MRSPPLPRPEPPALAQAATSNRASQEDLSEYLAFLDDTNLCEAQKIELLQTPWSIMSAFVDLAFGTDPVQQALPSTAATQRTDDFIVSASKAMTDRNAIIYCRVSNIQQKHDGDGMFAGMLDKVHVRKELKAIGAAIERLRGKPSKPKFVRRVAGSAARIGAE